MSDGENVKVAVRVRPFNGRERSRNATVIVDMKGPTTYLLNPENMDEEPRKFAFDYSYWSHDGCKDRGDGYWEADPGHPNGKKFCDQKMVYDNLGEGVLANAWGGYNSTLFAYGQTGSGKSWSMVGYGVNKGIVPLYTEQMYKDIEAKKGAGDTEYEVMFSMLEIYNEQVRDLLNPATKKGGLKVRQHPKMGFYAENLTEAAVGSYVEIEAKIEEGTTNRTVASTNMNATSSRAHTIVGITLIQKFKNAAGEDTTKTAVVNLVDLAGSERAESTGATGDRLKEGAAINQSLSSLGNVIAALAEKSNGKSGVRVPYRDSVLTKLLKNALGGNSKTIMIAAVSPADINYDESLSTLRYADRAKQIKTVAKVNEDPTEKLIRELSEENERLKKMLESGGVVLPKEGEGDDGIEEMAGMSEEEKAALKQELEDEYKAELEENDRKMREMQRSFEEKLKEAQENSQANNGAVVETAAKSKTTPHLSNLNYDPQLSGKIIHLLDTPVNKVGNQRGSKSDITIIGKLMLENHATITAEGGKYFIEKDNPEARIMVDGVQVTGKEQLDHNECILFGTNQFFVFINPAERDARKGSWPEVTWDDVQEKIAAASGFDMKKENKSKEEMLLQEDLMHVIPSIDEANAISQELDKKMKFEVIIATPEARGQLKGRTEIMVRATNLETDHEWIWDKSHFLNRMYAMREVYEDYQDGEDVSSRPAEKDPFVEDENKEVYIGSVKVWLQSLAYMIECREQLEITSITGEDTGFLNIDVVPCDKKGNEYTEKDDKWVESSDDMIGKALNFVVKLNSAIGIPSKYTEVFAKYKVYLEDEAVVTSAPKDTSNPKWKFKKVYNFDIATEQLVKYLTSEAIMVQIWGKNKPCTHKKSRNTKALLQQQSLAKSQVSAGNTNVKTVDPTKVKFMMLNSLMEKKTVRLEQRMAWLRNMIETAEKHKKKRIAVRTVRAVMDAPSATVANKAMSTIPKEKTAENSDSSDDEDNGGSKTCSLM